MGTSKFVRMFSVMMALFMCLMVTMPVVAYGTANTDTVTNTKPVTESVTEPITEHVTEHVTEPVTEHVTEPITLDDLTEVFSLDNNSKAIIILSIAVLLSGVSVFLWGISTVLKSISNFIIEFLKCLPVIMNTIFKVFDKLSPFVKNSQTSLYKTLMLIDLCLKKMFTDFKNLYKVYLSIAGSVLCISFSLLLLSTNCLMHGHVIIGVLLVLFSLILLYAFGHFANQTLRYFINSDTNSDTNGDTNSDINADILTP